MNAYNAALKCCELEDINTILDIGCGVGDHTSFFSTKGKKVTAVDIINRGFNIVGEYSSLELDSYDLIWASHILEHQLNVHDFLKKCRKECNKYICITVPPLKHNIVGGHVTIWNAGLVMYNLVLAGFNCRNAKILQYGYNISVIAEVDTFTLPALNYDYGDVEKISQWLPENYNTHGFDGNITEYNWN